MKFNLVQSQLLGGLFLVLCVVIAPTNSEQIIKEAYFNGTSYIRLKTPMTIWGHSGISFRSCRGGEILSQRYSQHILLVSVLADSIVVKLQTPNAHVESRVPGRFLDNNWHTLQFIYQSGNLNLIVDKQPTIIANTTYNNLLITDPEIKNDAAVLILGKEFSGCLLSGPGLIFDPATMSHESVEFGPCPLAPGPCTDQDQKVVIVDHCLHEPCMRHGTCESTPDGYVCHCTARYSGKNCEVDTGAPCSSQPCQHGAKCLEDINGDFKCTCMPGYTGRLCETEISVNPLCEKLNCLNNGTCRAKIGAPGVECDCLPGFIGNRCETDRNDCDPQPCLNNGRCVDNIDGFICDCEGTGYSGTICQNNINECISNPCLNGGTCFDTYGSYICECQAGFGGINCQINMPKCPPGFTGPYCEIEEMCAQCPSDSDCVKGRCVCKPGMTGISGQCTALSGSGSPTHKSARSNACASYCFNGATCIGGSNKNLTCICANGFTGTRCESPLASNDCGCINGGSCNPNTLNCTCLQGFEGKRCEIDENANPCTQKPCKNGATCLAQGNDFICKCADGYNGTSCDIDIDECDENPKICSNGLCINHPGYFECYCKPGWTGWNCSIDVDECLSHPCKNGATCKNMENNYSCECPPGYTNKDCSEDINECEKNECFPGSICRDGIANFTCECVPGRTGRLCDIDINDCESEPCLNGGHCIDQLNGFKCDCESTGFYGQTCEKNIDECLSTPCQNEATCVDKINDYQCQCHPGYTGKNCEEDINECMNNPCKYGGTCLEKSNMTLYQLSRNQYLPDVFNDDFKYESAEGYECVCVPGTSGTNCAENADECSPNPCKHGNCIDGIGNYTCDCEPGFEGRHCQIDINECVKYKPCDHGTCIDGINNYICDCDSMYGGKNCSVRLSGCDSVSTANLNIDSAILANLDSPCLNNGTCTPYLYNENEHKFNCTCNAGYQGEICEQVTTMSLNTSSLIVVNTTRGEGYDIQLSFRTTLSSGILAFGTALSYSYILELVDGKLNLHSSLLNKWEGVFIGSQLNNSKWHKVFVAINSSHLVLSADEEQTIYPINSNEGGNGSHIISFPVTYLGGTIPNISPYFRHLATHGATGPFLGCMQDVVINGQWVLPDKDDDFVKLTDVQSGCPRKPQCESNPCFSNGQCTDLWHTFSCSCTRPHLGHTCKYSYNAVTFGHENTNKSSVKVGVYDGARRAIRSVLDISMFIRTRQPNGEIFYLGADPDQKPPTVIDPVESYVSAFLQNGELLVRMKFNGNPEQYTVGGNKLDNGYNHLIQVIRNSTLIQVKLNGTEYFRKTLSTTGQLNAQVLYLGGPPANTEQFNSLYNNDNEKVFFKGIIQDVQVSNGSHAMVVEIYPLKEEEAGKEEGLAIPPAFGHVEFELESVLKGAVSDDLCRNTPCEHGGTCQNTWNDFICICPKGYKNKFCQEIEYCDIRECPGNATCRNLDGGYECITNMTLHDENDPLSFAFVNNNTREDSKNTPHTIEISYRTKFGGTLLYVHEGDMYFSISTIKNQVTIQWMLAENVAVTHRFEYEEDNNYDWHTIFIRVIHEGKGKLEAGFKGWEAMTDPQPLLTSPIDGNAYSHLFNGKHLIYLGGMPDQANNAIISKVDNGSKFRGCLGETRVGGYLLPYFPYEEIYREEDFVGSHFRLNSSQPEEGCILCFQKSCKNGGICSNPSEKYACDCPPGYESDDCSQNIDECLTANCTNNSTCIDGIANYTCQCLDGYEGLWCENEIDECLSSPCMNGGMCRDLLASYVCECTDDYIGQRCDQLKLVTCENQPCRNASQCIDGYNVTTGLNFTCHCTPGYIGASCDKLFCEDPDTPCHNSGHCVAAHPPYCRCTSGYGGKFCEVEIDECASIPCQNNGRCTDKIADYTCECSGTGFQGRNCDIDIDECIVQSIDCGPNGECVNIPGSYKCRCPDGKCGHECSVDDPCQEEICENGGTCVEDCDKEQRYFCNCVPGFIGVNCTDHAQLDSQRTTGADIALIVVPVVIGLFAIVGALIGTFIVMARNKRATRGTYSPSAQEYCNPRLEMDNVLKPPPEERLI